MTKPVDEISGQDAAGSDKHSLRHDLAQTAKRFLPKRFSLPHRFHRRTKPGEVPGRVAADPEAPQPIIHVMGYGPKDVGEATITELSQLEEFLTKYSTTWINVNGLGDGDLIRALGERFELHPLALEDVVNVHQRAKVEDYDEYLFLVARMIELDDDNNVQTEQISMFLGENYVLTFQERPGDCLDPVRQRIRKSRGKIRSRGADYLSYAVLDAVIDGYFPVVEVLSQQLEELDSELDNNITTNTTARLHRLRRDLLLVQRSIWPHREAVNQFSHLTEDWITDETRLFLRDCHDHVMQLIEIVETYREMCADVRDVYVSEISLRMNAVMKFLTLIATIFIPLNFLAALYGMNFNTRYEWNMPELRWPFGYPLVLLLMVVIGVVMLTYFWKKGWLRE